MSELAQMGLVGQLVAASWRALLPPAQSQTAARPFGTACVEQQQPSTMAFAASTATRAFAAPAKLATRSRRTVAVQVRAGRPGASAGAGAAAAAASAAGSGGLETAYVQPGRSKGTASNVGTMRSATAERAEAAIRSRHARQLVAAT